jgi:hypothetical protein
MSEETTDPQPKRRSRRKPAKLAGSNGNGKAPAFNKGLQPIDVKEKLANASSEQVAMLMGENLALWAQYAGVEVDQRKFDFDEHRYLLDIYLSEEKEVAWMKSAQMGATIYEVLWLLWNCRYNQIKAALYFPTSDGVTKLAKDRLNPLIQSNAELRMAVSQDQDALGLKQIDNIYGKKSSLYMLYLGGQASKDSVPLDVLAFDEVRLCDTNDMDQALERVSHSRYKLRRYVSTAGYPNLDIHSRFLRGDQRYWHVKCLCPDGFIPSETFPECVAVTKKEVYLRCPKCKARIHDPQNGRYVAHNPGADYPSFHISQFISKFITVKEIWTHYTTALNKKEFFNAKLGKPFVDEENMPITDDILENTVNPDLRWLIKQHRKEKRNCAMGVDQHGGNVFVVIAKRGPDGKKRIVHLELVESANPNYWESGKPVSPFKRLYELMREFDIGMCCIDAMPNYNEAAQFARDFPGRVFISWYGGESQKDMVLWLDRARMKEGIRRGSKEIKVKWQVSLNRYTSIDYALNEFVERNVEMPHPDSHVMVVRSSEGRWEAENICRTRFWLHLKSIVRQKTVIDESTGRYRMEWVYLGRDPHFVHAWNYCNIAIERLKRQAILIM